ncbi:alpha/beta fold hydrolase [Sphingomonas sp. NFR15]|uniref:alpha/beta fold hydrolase n=1 Tax=Sphingomonas sp. NFR15 TaxID=1566282 RepID=UPI00088AC381|nr:alpha/beta fold hydrolase [Sphingomonas sp. NFR15]SDA35926.1 Pimeloyl-ACP methyl ester carboxylesterase [Sphingomonas sp. NFR15]
MTAEGEGVAGMPAPETIDFEGLSVRLVRGGTDRGLPILLTSPWPQSVLAFRFIWDALAELGPLIAVDLPGFGRSDASYLALCPSGMGGLVVRLLDHLGIQRCHAVGPDVGTPALLFAAHEAPDLFATITVGSGGTDMSLVGDRLRGIIEGPESGLDVGDDAAAIVEVIKALSALEPSAEVMEDYRLSSAHGRYREAAQYVRAYPRDLPLLQGFAGGIGSPVLVISGADDPLVPPSNGALLERLIPDCRHEVLKSGHFVWEDAAAAYASLVSEWIRTGGRGD